MQFYFTASGDDIRDYIPDNISLMVSAASSIQRRRDGSYYLRKLKLPSSIKNKAADCGGYTAMKKWSGEYLYSAQHYVEWLRTWSPVWSAMMDYCCEPDLGYNTIDRQNKTTDIALHIWRNYREETWAWVPTIQGWEISDYEVHAREMKSLIDEMREYYGPDPGFRVGIGTLCKRLDNSTINKVVDAVVGQLGYDVQLHLWGVKLGYLQSSTALPNQIRSVDSAAWNDRFGSDIEKQKSSGLTQRQYGWTVALPDYKRKVDKALDSPKQMKLF